MSKIKTREIAEKGIKTLDKAAVAGERMKAAYIRTKESAAGSVSPGQESSNEYTGNKMEYAAGDISREVIHGTGAGAQKAVQRGREAFKKQREKAIREKAWENSASAEQPAAPNDTQTGVPTAAPNPADEPGAASWVEARSHQLDNVVTKTDRLPQPAMDRPYQEPSPAPAQRSRRSIAKSLPKTKGRSIPAERQEQPVVRIRGSLRAGRHTANTVEPPARGSMKTAQKTVKQSRRAVKTAEQAAKVTIKTAGAAENMTRKTAQAAAGPARAAAQAVRTAARTTVMTAKDAAKAVASAVKVSIAAGRDLAAAFAAGGWTAILAVVLICMIGLLAGSVFGIFFSSEDTGTGQAMQTAVREINTEYESQITAICAGNPHDILETSGTRAAWPEVLAVYAVKTAASPDNPQEAASMDDSKKALLREVFWAMNGISYRIANEIRDTGLKTVLYIMVTHRTAEEMADYYGFSTGQCAQLAALLADENQGMWSAVLYGIGAGSGQIVEVALSQIGNVGGEPYWSWYGFSSRVEWCACFVSWCANESGCIESGTIPRFSNCVTGSRWFKDRGQWQDRNYEPRPGDIIFFDWDKRNVGQDGRTDHVGIVEKVENGRVYTVEGNSGDRCREKSYPLGYYEIHGYGTPG